MFEYCVTVESGFDVDDPGVSAASEWDLGSAHWFGGGEEIPQKWPLETYDNLTHSLVTQEARNRGIQDPFWFNSDGLYIFVHPGAPLFVSINPADNKGKLVLTSRVTSPYRPRPGGFLTKITSCKTANAKEAFQLAVENHLGKPTGYPDELMIRYPVWSTWAQYKSFISDVIVREFAKEIKDHGFTNSQLEIDDAWETCYGSKEVDKTRFPDMKKLTDDLKAEGFRVTIWTHPFINEDCTETLNEANSQGFLVKDMNGSIKTKWWNGNGSIVDFTKKDAQTWFINKHKAMMEANGIDGFKFDAGETSWNPQLPALNIPSDRSEDYPNLATQMYVETCSTFNNLTEVRSAYRTQKLPIFVRMIDKDSRWGDDNGLKSLVTTLLQMNMVGYSMVLPDMIGGNQYGSDVATKELFVRWLQANVFMPALQYALVPWNYDVESNETVQLSQKFNDLHAKFTPIVIKAMKKNIEDGSPVNPPIWWLDPTDENALKESTEFLLGEEILSAPILEENQGKRDIYLPKGSWKDGNTLKLYDGPMTIKDYEAPLSVLPYFVIVGSDADKILDPQSTGGAASCTAPVTIPTVLFLLLSLLR
ncbi:hypothetical protein ONE63_000237 [Megalurothrips usitatus]|uniref:Myogenesis-regulating glycosidase-like n=1 Tax=Megalurothrips usitatus TaxID=439358 RepID=A0AAV7Y1P7_9NEOP|nr:hypothetical protein ONE63_000237 [Megalurothrips usitatus]